MDAAGARALKRRIEQYQAQRRGALTGAGADGDVAKESAPAAAIPEDGTLRELWIGYTPERRSGQP